MTTRRKAWDPLIEILAIKLYEHDHGAKWPVPQAYGGVTWMKLDEEDRELYRRMARGEAPLDDPPP